MEKNTKVEMKEYLIVQHGGEAEIVEKKSRFIATVRPVESEDEALQFIEEIRKKYWNARHNCFAYVAGENNELQRFSDDGEPQGTAGKPILEVLTGQKLHNVAVVVTRYFGGILLGTGGLVRAYSRATQEGIKESTIRIREHGMKVQIQTDYNGLGKIQYILGEQDIKVLESEYTDYVSLLVLLPDNQKEKVLADITEGTSGRAKIQEVENCWFLKE